MRKNSTMKNRTRTSVTRGRVAVVTGGLVAAIALGSTSAMAVGSQHTGALAAGTTSSVVQQQAAAKKAASWVTPTTGYTLGASYAQSGSHWAHKHSGQDFVVGTGTTVRTVHGGTVVEAGWGGAYGNNIVIKHADHTYSQYGHLSKIEVRLGETVNTAEEIGKSGSTGNSTGPHLHFEIRTTPYYGSSVEPLHFLRTHGVNVG
jgi:murein DD-endopeptidase MepM/ murein hydrolase activator NlpD